MQMKKDNLKIQEKGFFFFPLSLNKILKIGNNIMNKYKRDIFKAPKRTLTQDELNRIEKFCSDIEKSNYSSSLILENPEFFYSCIMTDIAKLSMDLKLKADEKFGDVGVFSGSLTSKEILKIWRESMSGMYHLASEFEQNNEPEGPAIPNKDTEKKLKKETFFIINGFYYNLCKMAEGVGHNAHGDYLFAIKGEEEVK